jgi:hypothetical protein
MIRKPLEKGRWDCLKDCGVCCDQLHLSAAPRKSFRSFSRLPRSVVPRIPSSRELCRRQLRACFALLDSMQGIRLVYVKGFERRVDVVYNHQQSTLKIHHRWLDFDSIHQRTSCRNWILPSARKESGKHERFFCGHIVEELLSLSISSVFGGSQNPSDHRDEVYAPYPTSTPVYVTSDNFDALGGWLDDCFGR